MALARPKMIYLPDTITDWPWPRAINPHFEAVKVEADAWFHSFKTLSTESLEEFDKGGAAYIVALGDPNASREQLRFCCDFMNIQVLVDEYTEVETAAFVKEMMDIIIDALHNPHKMRSEGEFIIGEIVRQCSARALQIISLTCWRRFIDSFTDNLRAGAVEAVDREQGHFRTIDNQFQHRRDTGGILPWLVMCQMRMDLPDEVFYHPAIVELVECAANMIMIDNDIVSYNKEQASGRDHNTLITVIMLEVGLDIGGAIAWAAKYHAEFKKRFIKGLAEVPSWGPSTDVLVKEYLDGVANWVRANYCWSFESERFFGTMGPEIQQNRLVPLLPKVIRKASTAVTKDHATDLYIMDATAHHERGLYSADQSSVGPQMIG
ncbi:terpenoid synthase [Suillus ampliporus]|nr:terpenoid synthase [Suillus ampliporus]